MAGILVIIPTYNEAGNVAEVVDRVFQLQIEQLGMLIVDDRSPDGTAARVSALKQRYPRLHLLVRRDQPRGLGRAYLDGYRVALRRGYDVIIQMDADLSHDPQDIPQLLTTAQTADWVIASRYLNGVSVLNWSLERLLLSVMANRYARWITGMPICDCTAGYKCFRVAMLRQIPLNSVRSNGYAFQIEMNFKVWKRGGRIREIPIVYHGRQAGRSKMTVAIKVEAFLLVLKLKLFSLFGKF